VQFFIRSSKQPEKRDAELFGGFEKEIMFAITDAVSKSVGPTSILRKRGQSKQTENEDAGGKTERQRMWVNFIACPQGNKFTVQLTVCAFAGIW
jgi:hypothetical protein